MRYRAVIFDLFGTLVRSFTRQEYDRVNAQMFAAVRVPYVDFWRLMGETYQDSCLGRYSSYEEIVADVCCRAGVEANMTHITQAARFHYEFMANALAPDPEVLEALDRLKKRGLQLGLMSDCGPAVPLLFPQSPLARFIDIPVFPVKSGSRSLQAVSISELVSDWRQKRRNASMSATVAARS